jgi:hypothetical protein
MTYLRAQSRISLLPNEFELTGTPAKAENSQGSVNDGVLR